MRLVLVPLKKELEALASVLNGVEKNKDGFFYKGTQFVLGGLGKVNFSVNTMKYVNEYKPSEVFAVGSCGSLTEGLTHLDLVVISKVLEHDFESSFMPIPEIKSTSEIFSEHFPDLRRVVCASGDKDVVSDKDKKEILNKTNAEIVTWESAGFFKAMKSLGVPFTEVRVVTDFADERAERDFKKNLSQGMQKLGGLFK